MLSYLKKLFKTEKKDMTGVPVSFFGYGPLAPYYEPYTYELYSVSGYLGNPYVQRCVDIIANTCAGIPWKLYRKVGDQDVEIEKSPILDLLYRPNPYMTQTDFMISMISYLQISGNAYVQKAGPRSGPPRELYLLRPDRIIIRDQGPYGCAYGPVYYYTCSGAQEKLEESSFFHLKNFNPMDDFYGSSPLSSAFRSVLQSNFSMDWNVALLQNSANPSGVLTMEGNLSDDQVERLKGQLKEKYQGKYNSGRPMVLEGGLKWEQMSLSANEIEWIAGQKLSAKQICIAFGVPPEMLADSENKTYNNYKESRSSFYEETVLPLMDRIREDFLNSWLLPLFPGTDQMFFDYDRDSIEALTEDRNAIYTRVIGALKEGLLTINEAREAIGYPEMEEPVEDEETPPPDEPKPLDSVPPEEDDEPDEG